MKLNIIAKSKPLSTPAGVQSRYNSKLKRLFRNMVKDYMTEIKSYYEGHQDYFDASPSSQAKILLNALKNKQLAFIKKDGKSVVDNFLEEVISYTNNKLTSELQNLSEETITLKNTTSEDYKEIIKSKVAYNISLITKLTQEVHDKVSVLVYKSISTGAGYKDIYDGLKSITNMTDRRADLIAQQETRTTANQLYSEKARHNGFDEFEWIHSGGGMHPRPYHRDVLNGQIFKFSDLPIIDEDTGERGLPGQLINCRCTMRVVVTI